MCKIYHGCCALVGICVCAVLCVNAHLYPCTRMGEIVLYHGYVGGRKRVSVCVFENSLERGKCHAIFRHFYAFIHDNTPVGWIYVCACVVANGDAEIEYSIHL